ncbi:MAG: MFS transporter [Sphingomonadales bacterium]|nr:MFS transporter [Sphingomonadales bacterium]MDE2569721.1 MFS transporter [Sphingomonadales bacterium]
MAERETAQAWITVVVLMIVATLNFVDRQILSVLVEPIRADLHFSDSQFGLLTGLAFSLFYAMFGIPVAMLADRVSRVKVVAVACAVWSLFTALTGFTRTFAAMAAVRFGIGVGEAGGTAPSLSLLADRIPPERRAFVFGLYNTNGPIGVFAGAAFGGWAAGTIGWQRAFMVLGVIGLVMAPMLLLLVREPRRGHYDGAAAAAAPLFRVTLANMARDPAMRLLCIASGLSSFVSYGMLNWIPAYLMRVQHMPIAAVATWFAPAAGLTMGTGMVAGGWLVSRTIHKSPRGYALVPAFATALLVPLFAAALFVDGWALSLALMLVPMTCCIVFVPPSLVLVQQLGPPSARATTTAALLLMYNIVGLGLGPLMVGALSDLLHPALGIESLRFALVGLLAVGVVAMLAQLALARRLERLALV